MHWHELKLGMDDTGTGQRVWKLLWTASVAGEPADEGNAIFAAHRGRGRMTLYFPPCASLLATGVGATACAKPDAQGLMILAGRPGAWQVHFATRSASLPDLKWAAPAA